MKYEVEQKYPIADLQSVEAKLVQAGADIGPPVVQVDRYFAHPSRDFATTDEALRIRRSGNDVFITYKGPKLDRETKTRREIELPLPAGDMAVDQYSELLQAMGFSQVAEVRKQRRQVTLKRAGMSVELVFDDVEQVGEFVEIEVLATEDSLDAAQDCVTNLAFELGLLGGERRSYLEMLLEKTN
jgi:adenylate cyclase class 2